MTEEAFEARFREEWEKYKQERNERLHRFTVRALIILAVVGLTMAGTVGYVAWTTDNNREALCAVRADAENRVEQTKQFLEENPNGIPGISPEQLKRSTENSVRTAEAIQGVSCPEQR